MEALSFTTIDIVTFVPIIFLAGALFHLSNKELKKSLEQSKTTQEILARDREILQDQLSMSQQELRDSRLARLNELARAAEFGRLSQGLFHDLMTPLTSIILHTEKLKETAAAQQNIEKAVEASQRMAAYVKNVRSALSREEAERSCFLHEELKGALSLLSFAAREKGIEIKILRADECIWFGSPMKLQQLFSNLISNAIDSYENMEADAKRVEISLFKERGENVILITDYGCGIPALNISKVFDPFFTTKSQEKGTGIGLTAVQSIVENNLKGKVRIKSEEGRGTSFTITFPQQNTNPAASLPPR